MDEETTLLPVGVDATEHGFDVVLRGYDRQQVDRHLAALEALLTQAEREAEVQRAEAERLRTEADRARHDAGDGAASYDGLGRRVTRILSLAEEEATVLREQARREREQAARELGEQQTQGEAARRGIMQAAERDASEMTRRANERAEALLAEASGEAERLVSGAREQVEALRRERDAIRGQLAELRSRLSVVAGEEA